MNVASRTLVVLLVMLAFVSEAPTAGAISSTRLAATHEGPGSQGLFVENIGQFAAPARFRAGAGDTLLWLTEDGLWVTLLPAVGCTPAGRPVPLATARQRQTCVGVNLKLSFAGANPHPILEPVGRSSTQFAFFRGSDPARWRSHVPAWRAVTYHDLYPGIALELTSDVSGWTPRLHVQPGADLAAVRLRVEGVAAITIDGNAMVLDTAAGDYRLPLLEVIGALLTALSRPEVQDREIHAPFASSQPPAPADGMLPDDGTFDLIYGAFLGGTGTEFGPRVAVDNAGATYITGYTRSADFPTTPGAFDLSYNGGLRDVFVAKVSPDGSRLVYSTFLGGPGSETGTGIAVDATGAAHVTGEAGSDGFPTTPGAYDTTFGLGDVFVTKLSADGSELVYSTYLGGSNGWECQGYESPCNIAIDASGNTYVVGTTFATDFPVTPGAVQSTCHDCLYYYGEAFVSKLNAEGTALVYSTYLGGSRWEWATDIAVDAAGAAYVTGSTNSWDFPVTPGAFAASYAGGGELWGDGFVAKLNPDGTALAYSTYLGGSQDDCVNISCRLAVGAGGYATVVGETQSPDFPSTPGAFDPSYNGGGWGDGFVTRLTPSGSALDYSTFLGGSGDDGALDVALGADGAAYVSGVSASADFPTTPDAFSRTLQSTDATLSRLSPDGATLAYSTFLGGLNYDAGTSVVLSTGTGVHIVGNTHSADFPTTPGAFNRIFRGEDLFVAKLVIGMRASQYLPVLSLLSP